jgi:thioredoxin 1
MLLVFRKQWRLISLAGLAALVLLLTLACSQAESTGTDSSAPAAAAGNLPRLVDLGADKCIPCKMMAPILEELKEEYAGRMEVEFIDVWKKKAKASEYGIQMIPTQIFYDASGKELFRRTGFIGKEDILATWKRLGYDFKN